MYIPAWLILICILGVVSGGVSLVAVSFQIPLAAYWTVPIAAGAPWLLTVVFAVMLSSFEADPSRGQALLMSAMWPMFGLITSFGMAMFASFFVPQSVTISSRALYSGAISGIPAICTIGFFIYLFLGK